MLVEKLLDTLRVPVDDLVFVVPPDDGPLQPRDFNEYVLSGPAAMLRMK